ncbi:MAG: ATP-binding protein [Proteobacteria bacterium]|nr:ATP-binding protein [Pseudomonadota bacterium]
MFFLDNFINSTESEEFDRKREHHENVAELVHDILCLANSSTSGNKFLIFGVSNQGEIIGVEADTKRKKQSQLLDTLRSSNFNRLPIITLYTVDHEGHEVDVLEIENRPDKPYFLTKDKKEGKKCVRARVIYTRYGDTNTPMDGCADEMAIERMFRERFGLDRPPVQQLMANLKNVQRWKWGENEENESYFYDQWNPEFTITKKSDTDSLFIEGWSQQFPDSKAYKDEYLVKFHNTLLRRIFMVSCDGCRYLTVLPKLWGNLDESTGRHYTTHFFIEDSLEYLVNRMIHSIYPHQYSRRYMPEFPIFSSQEEAEQLLSQDFAAERKKTYIIILIKKFRSTFACAQMKNA